jgi:pimeloyl-ACP methyl ester carboxylesterase
MEQTHDISSGNFHYAGIGAPLNSIRETYNAQFGIRLGASTYFGMFGLDARIMGFDPRDALKTIQSPGLFIFSEHDDLVTPSLNIGRMNEIFDNDLPNNFYITVLDNATHAFQLVNDPCVSWINPEEQDQSEQLTEVLHTWLTEQGY